VSKNSFLQSEYLSKNKVALFLIAAMLIGFLGARAIGSIAIFLFTVNALRDVPPRQWFREKWWLLGLIWIGMYAISWFWTDSQEGWNDHIQVKIPFLLLPLAFGFLPRWGEKELRRFTILLLGIMASGVCFSLSFLLRDTAALIESYKYSKILRTPVYGDHITFSTAIAVCVAWCFYILPVWHSRLGKGVVLFTAVFFILYLHILAAKTGLVALYLFFALYLFRFLLTSWKRGLLAIVLSIAGFVAIYRAVPTFRERINYTRYTYERFFDGHREGHYSDMGRIISYELSWKLIKEHPLLGVGAGDMMDEMSRKYEQYYPAINDDEKLIPHNQFLTIALAAGIPAMLAFIIWIMVPLGSVKRNREGFFFVALWLMLLVQLFTDPSLEVQFGVFVYLFFLLLQRKLLLQPADQ